MTKTPNRAARCGFGLKQRYDWGDDPATSPKINLGIRRRRPADGIHGMTEDEAERYGLRTR